MFRVFVHVFVTFLGIITLGTWSYAEEQETSQKDSTPVIEVSKEGNQLTINVDGSKLRFSFTEVAMTTSVATETSRQAEQLLLKGLESQLLYGSKQKEIGLLAEAHRLAPNDARISYWYARGLANAGLGKAAREVFDSQRDAIDAAYPGFADRLAKQIKQRMQLELLPAKLVRQIDAINAAVGGVTSLISDKESCAAYFRLVDQNDQPIEPSAFRISCNGQDENLQSYDSGYHLFTYVRRRNSNQSPCKLEVTKAEILSKTFEFTGAADGVAEAGDFRVKRMTDEDRRPVIVKVTDVQGEPLADVTVSFIPRSGRRSSSRIPSVKTNGVGHVETRLFPNSYNCNLFLTGYNRATRSFEIALDATEPNTVEVKLHRLITATVKVQWNAEVIGDPHRPQPIGETTSTGEIELRHGDPAHSNSTPHSAVPWVRLLQKDDQLQLQFIEQPRYGSASVAGTSWIGRVDTSEGSAVGFEAIDLANLDDWKKKAKLLPPYLEEMPGRHQPVLVATEQGALYVGKIMSRDVHGRYLQLIDFKILVAEQGDSASAQ